MNKTSQTPHMVFFGRWAPLHSGHTWLIEKKIKENPDTPVLIFIRDTSFDPISAEDRKKIVDAWLKENNINGKSMIIDDIKGVYWGRGVGYEVEENEPPENIEMISATKIREMIKNKDDSWKNIVAKGTADITEKIFKNLEGE